MRRERSVDEGGGVLSEEEEKEKQGGRESVRGEFSSGRA